MARLDPSDQYLVKSGLATRLILVEHRKVRGAHIAQMLDDALVS